MSVRLLWSVISPSGLGLEDANISTLTVDGDDLWVGTWNGGVSRYSVSSSHADPFPLPAFSRSIEIADRRVWIGTAEGLAWYGKSSGRWGAEGAFQSPAPRKVQVVRQAAGSLYVGTLGDGLFRRGNTGWDQVSDGDLPGRFITCIAADQGSPRLYIGTMNLGLVIYDPQTGAMSTLAETVPAFTSENIGTILPDSEGRVWIGTYGDGLSVWSPGKGTLRHFTKATQEISDDWVLASCETDHALYFGSFGGGVSVYLKETDSWKRLGIRDGLASLDVAAIAWRRPYVFFGTLGAGVSVYDEESDGE
jgi:ligand-binding sensor domain-containing protein